MARKCKVCGKEISSYSQSKNVLEKQKLCSVDCATEFAKARVYYDRGVKAKQTLDRVQRSESKKRTSPLVKAQDAFNLYIRVRDRNKECISCGKPLINFDAGHYKGVGARPNLRYNTLNVHGQCRGCNHNVKTAHITTRQYRTRLIDRLGIEIVERLDLDHSTNHYTKDDLERIARIFRKKAKLYEKLFR